jgi:hypothetical protein
MDRFTSENCRLNFLTVDGWYIHDVEIERFRGEDLFLMEGYYGTISIDDSKFNEVYLIESKIKTITVKNVSTNGFWATNADIDRMVLEKVSFGDLALDFENLQVFRFLVQDVTFETKKHLNLEGSNIDFEMGKRYWYIYR